MIKDKLNLSVDLSIDRFTRMISCAVIDRGRKCWIMTNEKVHQLEIKSSFSLIKTISTLFYVLVYSIFILGLSTYIYSQEQDHGKEQETLRNLDIEEIIDIPDEDRYQFQIKVVDSKGNPISNTLIKLPDVRYTKEELTDLSFLDNLSPKQKLEKFKQTGKPLAYGDRRTNQKGIAEINLWVYSKSLKKEFRNSEIVFYAKKEGYIDHGFGFGATSDKKKSSVSLKGVENKINRGEITLFKGSLIKVKLKGSKNYTEYINKNYKFGFRVYKDGIPIHIDYVELSKSGYLVETTSPHSIPAFPEIPKNGYLKIEMAVSESAGNQNKEKKYLPIKKKITKEEFEPGKTIHLELKKNPKYKED